jgi:cyclopropane fatty-acyl-phospholipid synthase-like methyltransferase
MIDELLDKSFFQHSLWSSLSLSCWCCPAFAPAFANKVIGVLHSLNNPLDQQEQDKLTECIVNKMTEGYKTDSHSELILSIKVGRDGLKINFFLKFGDLANTYSEWYNDKDRKNIMFGRYPDFKVLETVELFIPKTILDLGAGEGRNSLGLVRLYEGLAVDLVELTSAFFDKIIEQVEQDNLPVRGVCSDILDPDLFLESQYYDFIFCSEVLSHFRLEGLIKFFDRCSQWIKPDGILLINLFLADDNYELTDKARQLGEKNSSSCFTKIEMIHAIQNKFKIETIQDCYSVEKRHKRFHPPWYNSWATGRNIIPSTNLPPISLKWVSLKPNV